MHRDNRKPERCATRSAQAWASPWMNAQLFIAAASRLRSDWPTSDKFAAA